MEPAMKLIENQKLRMNTNTCLSRFHESMYMYRVQFIRHSIWGISTILLQKYFYKKLVKTAIKLYPILHDHYPDRFNDISRPNGNFSAQFKLLNTTDYTYLQENLHYTSTTNLLQTSKLPKIESNITNRMHNPPLRTL